MTAKWKIRSLLGIVVLVTGFAYTEDEFEWRKDISRALLKRIKVKLNSFSQTKDTEVTVMSSRV